MWNNEETAEKVRIKMDVPRGLNPLGTTIIERFCGATTVVPFQNLRTSGFFSSLEGPGFHQGPMRDVFATSSSYFPEMSVT